MNQWFSVLGLICSILVSAENSITALNNVLQSKPIDMDNNYYSTMKMKAIFSNKKFVDFDSNAYNFNKTKVWHERNNSSQMKNIIPNSRLLKSMTPVTFFRRNRFPRHAQQIYYTDNKEDTSGQYTKVILDFQPKNEDTYRDYYQEKNTVGLKDDSILNIEIEKNSKPVTRTLSESQERKRCLSSIQRVNTMKREKPQKLLLGSIEDEETSEFNCKNCKRLEPNSNLEESINNSSRLKQINDDNFINILKQLIVKLNKSESLKSDYKDLSMQKFNEPALFENKSVEERITTNSSEEDLILTLEKMKKNNLMDKLNSNPENIFINGEWVRNKIIENNNNLRSGLLDKNEPISISDIKSLDSEDLKNRVIENNYDIFNNSDNLKVIGTQLNNEVLTSPLPEKNEHYSVSEEIFKTLYLSSTPKYKLDSSTADENNNENNKWTTTDLMNTFEKENNFSNPEENNANQNKTLDSTFNNIHTTPIVENEDSTPDLNNKLNIKNSDESSESNIDGNDNYSKNNDTKDLYINSVKKENNSDEKIENNCSCNKKVIKNILSSTMIQNITEIRTDTYKAPKKLKFERRSDKEQKENGEINNTYTTSEPIIKKNSIFMEKKQVPSYGKDNIDEAYVKELLEPTPVNDSNYSQDTEDHSVKNKSKTTVHSGKSFELKPEDNRKRNYEENINNTDEIKNHKPPLISKNLPLKNPKQFVKKLKQDIPKKQETYVRNNNFNEYNNNINKMTNNRIPIFSKRTDRIKNRIVSQISPQNITNGSRKRQKFDENIIKKSPRKLTAKLKQEVPIKSNTQITRNFDGYNSDAVTTVTKIPSYPKTFSPLPIKSDNRSGPKIKSKQSDIFLERGDIIDVEKNSPRKLITESRIGKTAKQNIKNSKEIKYSNNSKDINGLVLNKLKEPLTIIKNINTTSPHTFQKNAHKDIARNNNPTKLIQTSNTIPDTIGEIQNYDIVSKYKLKKPFNVGKIKEISVPLLSNEKTPYAKHEILDKSSLNLKNNNKFNEEKLMKPVFVQKSKPNQNLKLKNKTESNIPSISKFSKESKKDDLYDQEHGPYTTSDLEPIIFDESAEKPKLSNRNSRFFFQHPLSWQSVFGNRLQNTPGSNTLQTVPIIRPEYDDYSDTWRNDDGKEINIENHQHQPELNSSNYGSTEDDIVGYNKYDEIKNPAEVNYSNQSRFEILPQLKVDDGVFKIPLVGYKDFNANGTEYISDIFIPIEKSDGQPAAISLTKLLSGDFHLLNKNDNNLLAALDLTSDMHPQLSSTQTLKNCANSNNTEKRCNPIILKTFQTDGGSEKQTAPIHIIQIINNGMCSDNCNGTTKIIKKNDRDNNFHKLRNDGKKVSSTLLQNSPNNVRKINQKLENAYNHFDSEILDRFLQVYNPQTV